MMLPPPARRICGTANLHIRNAPVRLTPMAWFHCASGSVSHVPSGVIAAATLTRVLSLPKAAMVCATAAWALASSATSTAKACAPPPIALRHAGGLGGIEVGNGNQGALGRKPPRDRAADLAAAAGNQRHPLLQPARHQWVAACTKLPSKIADFGGNGLFMVPMSNSPSAIFS